MFGIGPAELMTIVVFALSLGGATGLPLSVPPLPPDPVIERAAPDACLLHFATAGTAAPVAEGRNLTEQMLAGPEMQEFLERVAVQIMTLGRQAAPPEATDAMIELIRAALTRPMALTVETFAPPSTLEPPTLKASLVIRVGEQTDAIMQAAAMVAEAFIEGAPPEIAWRKVTIRGGTWRQINTKLGPVSWGINGGSLVVAIGEEVLESLLARTADDFRETPDWKADLAKRMPVARRSTLTYVDTAQALRIAASLPFPELDPVLRLLDISGIDRLQKVAAVSGMTDEGTVSSMWLGFDGPPQGLLAAPATRVGRERLARIPADAMLAHSWSLDLSESLALFLDMIVPDKAAEVRRNLEEVRAVVGVDLDTHLLKPLGPDWTVLSVPAPGNLIPGVAVIAGVRDRATFAKTHKALLGMLRNASAEADVQISVREVPYREHTLFCLEASGPEFAMPVTPTWCLTEDSLIVTISPQLIKTLLTRSPATAGIDNVREVKAAIAGGDPSLVGVVDPVWLLGSFCGLYEMAAPVARGMLRQQGVELDLPQLPPSSAIMPFARPSVTTIRHEADGILLASTATVPLGPLTSGGGILGISPVTAPVLVGLLLPAVQSAREAARRAEAMNNFKQVMLAMHMHESAQGRLPAQAICNDQGKPLLSWRVAILPFLEEGGLYQQFRLDEPWDSEHNRKLIEQMPAVFADPSAPAEQVARGLTTIQVLTGPETVFAKPGEGMRLGQISDGLSKTLAIVEATPENAVPWTKPDDLEFDPEQPLAGVGNPQRAGGLFMAGFFDGSVRTIAPDVNPAFLRAIVTPAGGEVVGSD